MTDPYIHVEVNLFRHTATRKMLASTFGLAADLPTRVTTGCGLQVPLARTSPQPRSVTCLPCREHAARWHLRAAQQVEEMHRLNGIGFGFPAGDLAETAREHRDRARRFTEP